jgi:hypothetical protein
LAYHFIPPIVIGSPSASNRFSASTVAAAPTSFAAARIASSALSIGPLTSIVVSIVTVVPLLFVTRVPISGSCCIVYLALDNATRLDSGMQIRPHPPRRSSDPHGWGQVSDLVSDLKII